LCPPRFLQHLEEEKQYSSEKELGRRKVETARVEAEKGK
jgi:hypothetical protein